MLSYHRSMGGAVCALALLLSGCALHRTHAFPWNTAVLVHPRVPAPAAAPGDAEPPPELRPAILEPSPLFLATRSTPMRPRGAEGPEANGAGHNSRATMPELSPQLTAEERTAAQQQTRENLAIAERNLNTATGHSLMRAQAELAAKIRSFSEQAREAARAGDWVGARTLAKKAQVLSEDLIRSL